MFQIIKECNYLSVTKIIQLVQQYLVQTGQYSLKIERRCGKKLIGIFRFSVSSNISDGSLSLKSFSGNYESASGELRSIPRRR